MIKALYGYLEVHVAIPKSLSEGLSTLYHFRQKLPPPATRYITKAVITGADIDATRMSLNPANGGRRGPVESCCDMLRHFTKLEYVRLHLEIHEGLSIEDGSLPRGFESLWQLKSLKTVEIDVCEHRISAAGNKGIKRAFVTRSKIERAATSGFAAVKAGIAAMEAALLLCK
jgi:hypothetical protein